MSSDTLTYKKLDGRALSKKLRAELKETISSLSDNDENHVPNLCAILVGDDPASKVYIGQKRKACEEVGIKFTLIELSTRCTTRDLVHIVNQVNENSSIHGCIVQLPLPSQIDQDQVVEAVSPDKDVDCFHSSNVGKLVLNKPHFLPATPYGIQLLLKHYKIPTEGKHIVILGKSLIVGQPLMNLLSLEGGARGTVTCCDKYTKKEDFDRLIGQADILVVATGKHHLISSADQIKEGVVIIDVGIHRISDETRKTGYRLEGDVDFQAVKDKVSWITPVPGGVGPMTVISLLLNTWKAFYTSKGLKNNIQ